MIAKPNRPKKLLKSKQDQGPAKLKPSGKQITLKSPAFRVIEVFSLKRNTLRHGQIDPQLIIKLDTGHACT
jgi:hypothetical protein